MRIRIVSDGTTRNSKIINTETDEVIDNVEMAQILLDAKTGLVVAVLKFCNVELNIVAETSTAGKALPE